jgi:predicted nucleic acid-binding protein
MASFVVDPSVALAWLLPDETNARANAVRGQIEEGAKAWIAAHWWLEVGNGLLAAERRGRISADQVSHALTLINALPLEEDENTAEQIPGRTLALARKHHLTIYDAAYLELAQRRGATLATLDEQLLKASKREKVPTASDPQLF